MTEEYILQQTRHEAFLYKPRLPLVRSNSHSGLYVQTPVFYSPEHVLRSIVQGLTQCQAVSPTVIMSNVQQGMCAQVVAYVCFELEVPAWTAHPDFGRFPLLHGIALPFVALVFRTYCLIEPHEFPCDVPPLQSDICWVSLRSISVSARAGRLALLTSSPRPTTSFSSSPSTVSALH